MRLILVACRMRRFPFLAASRRVFRLLSMLLLFAVAGVAYANPQAQTLWRLLDYIAVDYPAAIGEHGKVVSQLEYDEMTEFSATVREGLARMPAHPSGPAVDAQDRKSTRLNSSHHCESRMTSAACKKTNTEQHTSK